MKLKKFLFVFAHPDDETVACAATIQQLVQSGAEVALCLVTDGGAGEVMPKARKTLNKLGSISALRKQEMTAAQQHLGISQIIELGYPDGSLNNQAVWGKLTSKVTEIIDEFKPDVVITFDHTGWYFHLDHVGTSIATTIAFHQATAKPKALLLSHFYVKSDKWRYVFGPQRVTHRVKMLDRAHKLQAIELHQSQDLRTPHELVCGDDEHCEWYEVAFAESGFLSALKKQGIFEQHDTTLG
ncbi:MAG: PIG-L family deacetylase [Patescibacteria group bacterium]